MICLCNFLHDNAFWYSTYVKCHVQTFNEVVININSSIIKQTRFLKPKFHTQVQNSCPMLSCSPTKFHIQSRINLICSILLFSPKFVLHVHFSFCVLCTENMSDFSSKNNSCRCTNYIFFVKNVHKFQ